MPKKPVIPPEEVLNILVQYKTEIQININHSSADLWKTISQSLTNVMFAKALYTFVKNNKHQCLSKLQIDEAENKHKYLLQKQTELSEEDTENVHDFTIDISRKVWDQIGYTKKRLQNNKLIISFNSDWSDVFIDSLLYTQ